MCVRAIHEILNCRKTRRAGLKSRMSSATGRFILLSFLALLGAGNDGFAQPGTVQRKLSGASAKDIRIGVYVNVKPDCTAGTLPTIRLVKQPANGKVTIKQAKIKATNYKQCLALEVPGYVGFYRSRAGFRGEDVFTFEVVYPAGRTEVQHFTVTVGSATPTQGI